jgi:hypothetical protein
MALQLHKNMQSIARYSLVCGPSESCFNPHAKPTPFIPFPVLGNAHLRMGPGHVGKVLSIEGRNSPDTCDGQGVQQPLVSHSELGIASGAVGHTCHGTKAWQGCWQI